MLRILARRTALGYRPTTIERHSIASGATYAQCIGALTICSP